MSNLIKEICSTLKNQEFDWWPDVFVYAVYCIEKYKYKISGDPNWPDTIQNVNILENDFCQLKETLVETLVKFLEKAEKSEKLDYMVSCIWALGKCADPDLKELFIRLLKYSVNTNPNVLYQTIIALKNIGEKIGTHSSSILDVEKNHQSALMYLKNLV